MGDAAPQRWRCYGQKERGLDIRIAPVAIDASSGQSPATRIRAEQTKVIYRYLPALILINAVVGGAMVYGLWNVVPASTLVVWACVMTAVLAVRAASYCAYRRNGAADPHSNRSALVFTLGSALSGAHQRRRAR
jgi:hypothetical protein